MWCWNALEQLKAHLYPISCLAMHSDGMTLVRCSDDCPNVALGNGNCRTCWGALSQHARFLNSRRLGDSPILLMLRVLQGSCFPDAIVTITVFERSMPRARSFHVTRRSCRRIRPFAGSRGVARRSTVVGLTHPRGASLLDAEPTTCLRHTFFACLCYM